MGLLDSLVGGVAGQILGGGGAAQNPLGSLVAGLAGGNQAAGGNLLSAAMSMLQGAGGLGAIVSQFQNAGLGKEADSWVGTGPNMGISADQLSKALPPGALGQVAKQLGMPEAQAGGVMAQLLPELINQLTPGGSVGTDSDDLLSKGLSMLKGLS